MTLHECVLEIVLPALVQSHSTCVYMVYLLSRYILYILMLFFSFKTFERHEKKNDKKNVLIIYKMSFCLLWDNA